MIAKPFALAITTAMAGAICVAQESDDVTNCVYLPQVDHTDVVDEDTILFYMNDETIYRNVLPHSCPGLDADQPFMYRVPTSQLCSVDVITVLNPLGSGFWPGASCGLGKFQSISEETVDEIKAAADRSNQSGGD